MNPVAISLWLFCAAVGYLLSVSFYGTVAGLTVGLALTLSSDLFYISKGK